jgi:hypothetical protein
MIHSRHKYLGDRWSDRNAPVILRIGGISFTLIQGDNLGCAPGLRGSLGNGAGVQEVSQTFCPGGSHEFQ